MRDGVYTEVRLHSISVLVLSAASARGVTCLPLKTAGVEAREAGAGVVGLGEDVEGREGVGDGVARARRQVGGAVVGDEGEGVEEALQGAGDLPGAGGGGGHGVRMGRPGAGAVFGGMKWRWRAGW